MNDGFDTVTVAVALVNNSDRQYLWALNTLWGKFALPMTKQRRGPAGIEPPEQAAMRAAAEVLGVPVQAGACWPAAKVLEVSGRDQTVKRYAYTVVRVEPHPDYPSEVRTGAPHLWLEAHQALSGEYRPLSQPCLDLLAKLLEEGLVPGRSQLSSTLVVRREHRGRREFLLRWHPRWGYALPSKRRSAREPARAAAERAIALELGLRPGRDVALTRAREPTLTLRDVSASAGVPTFYAHALYEAALTDAARPESGEPLAWASGEEIASCTVRPTHRAVEGGDARPGQVSRTAARILTALGHLPESDPCLYLP
jgi:hypothetical protein